MEIKAVKRLITAAVGLAEAVVDSHRWELDKVNNVARCSACDRSLSVRDWGDPVPTSEELHNSGISGNCRMESVKSVMDS